MRFPDFGKELKRPFEVDERCYDCAEFYYGCKAMPESLAARCADYLRLPDVGVNGKTGQDFPPSKLHGRQPRPPCPQPTKPSARQPDKPAKTKTRACGCGAPLPKGRQLCDACRANRRRQTKRQYMHSYMEQRRSGVSGSDSGIPFPAQGTASSVAGVEDLP